MYKKYNFVVVGTKKACYRLLSA